MKYLHAAGYSLMLILLIATYARYELDRSRLHLENQVIGYRLQWIQDSALGLSRGEGRLLIYSMKDADQLLSCFATRTDVERVSLEMTDVGAVGISAIASMPNVHSISFSGDFGVNDETLLLLAKCTQLKTLELTCTKVTDAGIASLSSQIPDCKIQRH